MSRFPGIYPNKQKPAYNLSDVYISPVDGAARGTGSDLSESSYVLYIGSAATERIVALKGFIESYKINFQKQIDEDKQPLRKNVYYTDKSSNLSINVELNLPAHSVNESRNNTAKIEELQKLIIAGTWEEGSNVSKKTNITVPIMLVHFRNLISNSRKVTSLSILSFDDLLNKGFPCYIDKISFSPDTQAGFFEFDNFLYPKNLKLSLELKYESESLFNSGDAARNKVTIYGFSSLGELFSSKTELFVGPEANGNTEESQEIVDVYDDGMFPFHSSAYTKDGETHSMKFSDMNNFNLSNNFDRKSDSFIFISIYSGAANDYALYGSKDGKVTSNNSILRHVFLELFLESFQRSFSVENKTGTYVPNSSVYSKLESQGQEELSYELKINMPATDLIEAKQNCAKIQTLSRMFIKRYSGSETAELSYENQSNLVKVYVPSFIEAAGSPKSPSRNIEKIFKDYSIHLLWTSFNFTVDMEAGFFTEGEFIFPKSISIDMTFKTHDTIIAGYNFINQKKPAWKPNVTESNHAHNLTNSHLFPYNRKTIKI